MSHQMTGIVQPMTDPDDTTKFRHRVAGAVRAHAAWIGITDAELSRRTHIASSTLSRRLTGQIALDTDQIEAIARALNTTPEDLITNWVGPADNSHDLAS